MLVTPGPGPKKVTERDEASHQSQTQAGRFRERGTMTLVLAMAQKPLERKEA